MLNPKKYWTKFNQDVDPALLIFLNGIDEIEVWARQKRIRQISRKRKETAGYLGKEVTLYQNKKVISRWLLFDAPKCEIEDRLLIEELQEKSWNRVSKVGFALAFPLDAKGKLLVEVDEPTKLFVYFPTNELSGLRYRIHGDFYIDASRKSLETRPYNLWLAKKIAIFLAKKVITELVRRFPNDERIVQAMVPVALPQEFALEVYRAICHELSGCEFVPTIEGQYTSPNSILLSPRGVWVDLESFQRYFPYRELANKNQNRRFPVEKLYAYEWAIDFLAELGAKLLEYQDVLPLLDGRDPTGTDQDFSAFYSFLWKWRDRLAEHVEDGSSNSFDYFHRRDRLDRLRNSFSSRAAKIELHYYQ